MRLINRFVNDLLVKILPAGVHFALWVKCYHRDRQQYGVLNTLLPELVTNNC